MNELKGKREREETEKDRQSEKETDRQTARHTDRARERERERGEGKRGIELYRERRKDRYHRTTLLRPK